MLYFFSSIETKTLRMNDLVDSDDIWDQSISFMDATDVEFNGLVLSTVT